LTALREKLGSFYINNIPQPFVYVVALGGYEARSKAGPIILGGPIHFRTAYQDKPNNHDQFDLIMAW
jgi:hypothetical protein